MSMTNNAKNKLLAPLAAAAALAALATSSGCMPSPMTWPKGPDSTKTGFSVTYKLNGRTDEQQLEAEGGIPSAGNELFRVAPAEPKPEKSEKAE